MRRPLPAPEVSVRSECPEAKCLLTTTLALKNGSKCALPIVVILDLAPSTYYLGPRGLAMACLVCARHLIRKKLYYMMDDDDR